MSTLRVDTIQNAAGTDSPISVPGTAKAWVNFNGTGTVAIRASYNVSSITDNGTGDYTVNFTTAMPDANYSTVASTARDSSSYWDNLVSLYPAGQYSTAGVRIITAAMSAQQDRYYVTVAIFR